MHGRKVFILIVVLAVIGGAIYYLESKKVDRQGTRQPAGPINNVALVESKKNLPRAVELQGISGYINSEKFTLSELIGKKVILVDFWTYSCINCQRTQPYLNAWYDKYRDQGLEIVGVHTPEFEFEKEYDNVKAATANALIQYPVVQDNDYATWTAYKNRYWPRKYLIDIDGYIVYDHIGEGAYAETEKKIQELLAERKSKLGETGAVPGDMAKPEVAVTTDPLRPRSPETYFGAWRNELLANGKINKTGRQDLAEPTGIVKNQLYLVGPWNIEQEYAENLEPIANVFYRYEGKAVYMVARSDKPVRVRIGLDGAALPESMRGADVGADGTVVVQSDRLYKLIEDTAYGEHTMQLIIEFPGVKIYTFTFG